jgi:hypothetical protein
VSFFKRSIKNDDLVMAMWKCGEHFGHVEDRRGELWKIAFEGAGEGGWLDCVGLKEV